jgi:hypothetical protein
LPNLTSSLTSITFKNTKTGKSSAAKTIKLTNSLTNKLGLGIVSVVARVDDTTDFTISKNACTGEVLPKKHCTISVKATPSAASTFSGNLIIDSDSNSGEIQIPLTVTGD